MGDQESVSIAVARMEERISNLEKLTETVSSLAASVKVLTESIKQTDQNVENLKQEVVEIHDRPAKRWETIVAALITAVVGVIIGHFIK